MQRPQDDVVPLHEPFETALRGFNRQQVLAHIESLDGRISMVVADRESALAQVAELSRILDHLRQAGDLLTQLRHETANVSKQAERVQQSPVFAASIRAQRMIQLAEEEAAGIKARAEQEVRDLKARTYEEVTGLKTRAGQEITARHKQATSEAEALLRDTAQRCTQLEAESGRRRKAAEQDLARRECEAKARIQSRDQRSIANLQFILKIVGSQLAQRVSLVEQKEAELADACTRSAQQLAALEELRAKITAQLSATRHVLLTALEQAQHSELDHPESEQPMPLQRDGWPGGRIVEGEPVKR